MPPKGSSTFSYPGSKVTIAPWIIDHFPQHECYVEPFGGSGFTMLDLGEDEQVRELLDEYIGPTRG